MGGIRACRVPPSQLRCGSSHGRSRLTAWVAADSVAQVPTWSDCEFDVDQSRRARDRATEAIQNDGDLGSRDLPDSVWQIARERHCREMLDSVAHIAPNTGNMET